MKTQWLLAVMAVGEAATGLALVAAPSAVAQQLVGSPLAAPAPQAIVRLAGVALFALGVACWLAGRNEAGAGHGAILCGMLVYNLGVPAVLSQAAIVSQAQGTALWPACLFHLLIATWCAKYLFFPSPPRTNSV